MDNILNKYRKINILLQRMSQEKGFMLLNTIKLNEWVRPSDKTKPFQSLPDYFLCSSQLRDLQGSEQSKLTSA